jgi:hypothetical protein
MGYSNESMDKKDKANRKRIDKYTHQELFGLTMRDLSDGFQTQLKTGKPVSLHSMRKSVQTSSRRSSSRSSTKREDISRSSTRKSKNRFSRKSSRRTSERTSIPNSFSKSSVRNSEKRSERKSEKSSSKPSKNSKTSKKIRKTKKQEKEEDENTGDVMENLRRVMKEREEEDQRKQEREIRQQKAYSELSEATMNAIVPEGYRNNGGKWIKERLDILPEKKKSEIYKEFVDSLKGQYNVRKIKAVVEKVQDPKTKKKKTVGNYIAIMEKGNITDKMSLDEYYTKIWVKTKQYKEILEEQEMLNEE